MEEDWELIKKRSSCIEQLHCSMDRILQQNNIETIKRTMLIHDNMFKQQVQELHRLYSVQKMMMKQVEGILHTASASSSGDQQDPISSRSVGAAKRATNNNRQPLLTAAFKFPNVNVDDDDDGDDEDKMGLMMVQETDIELTLSIATPTTNNASSSYSSSSFRGPAKATPQDYSTTVTLGLNTTHL